jgi:hypothetical protein
LVAAMPMLPARAAKMVVLDSCAIGFERLRPPPGASN